MLSTCFESDYKLLAKAVIVSSDISFFVWKVSHSVSDALTQTMHFIYLYCGFFKFQYTLKIIISFYPTECSIYLP